MLFAKNLSHVMHNFFILLYKEILKITNLTLYMYLFIEIFYNLFAIIFSVVEIIIELFVVCQKLSHVYA